MLGAKIVQSPEESIVLVEGCDVMIDLYMLHVALIEEERSQRLGALLPSPHVVAPSTN